MLRTAEHSLLLALADVSGQFSLIVGSGPNRGGDLVEICYHIHALQSAVMSQAATRAYPKRYRLLGDDLPGTEGPVRA
jgi:hypothetical protein